MIHGSPFTEAGEYRLEWARAQLTARQREILTIMADKAHTEDGELVMEGREVWLGLERTNTSTAFGLLRLCAIRLESGEPSGLERYTINETGLSLIGRRR